MDNSSHWDLYWRDNTSGHSFVDGLADNQDSDAQLIKKFWQAQFGQFPEQASILDIATGNGALVALALDYSLTHHFSWEFKGIDKAQIYPIVENSPMVNFYHEIDMACLPFDNDSVDVVISQFGFEYGDRDSTLKEIFRIMKEGARFVAMVHATESLVSKTSSVTLEILDLLTARGVFLQIMQFDGSSNFGEFQQSILNSLKTMRNEYLGTTKEHEVLEIMKQVGSIITRVNSIGLYQTAEILHQFVYQQEAHRERLRDQVNAALDQAELIKLQQQVTKRGVSLEYSPVIVESSVYAWQVVITKTR